MSVVADFVMDMLWPFLGHVLEYAGSLAIGYQRGRLQRRAIRKSESLNALVKSIFKFLPLVNTIYLASQQLGWMFILPTIVYLAATAWVTVFLETYARKIQEEKARRDDVL